MKASDYRTIIHSVLLAADGSPVTIAAIYGAVEQQAPLSDHDRRASVKAGDKVKNRQAAWKRNVRNVLQRDRAKGLILGGHAQGGYVASSLLFALAGKRGAA